MAAPRDYYDVLGLQRSATQDEIRAAHRTLVRKLHPDVNKEADASTRFSEVQEAYDVLSNDEKRAQYDRYGHAGVGAGHASGRGAGHAGADPFSGGAGSWRVDVDPADFGEVFEQFFRRGGDDAPGPGPSRSGRRGAGSAGPFAGGSSGSSRRGSAVRGDDHEIAVDVDFMSAALGGSRTIHLAKEDGGSEAVDVKIPAGMADGGRLRIRGKGGSGRRGGEQGDVLLLVRVLPHPWFRRDGLDILLDVPITIAEAALGATVEVPLLRGSVALKIPHGTASGQKLRVKGKGIVPAQSGADGERGDFFAVIQVVAPKSLGAEESAMLRTIAETLPDPRREAAWAGTLRT